MVCYSCGHQNAETTEFCDECRAPLLSRHKKNRQEGNDTRVKTAIALPTDTPVIAHKSYHWILAGMTILLSAIYIQANYLPSRATHQFVANFEFISSFTGITFSVIGILKGIIDSMSWSEE